MPQTQKPSLLVLSPESFSEMGGVGHRYFALAAVLRSEARVWTWTPDGSPGPPGTETWDQRTSPDLALGPPLALFAHPNLLASERPIIVDFFDFTFLENVFLFPSDNLRLKAHMNLLILCLWRANGFLVGHARQMDFLLGLLLSTGRLEADALRREAIHRHLFVELPTRPLLPQETAPWKERDSLVWWGGAWSWLPVEVFLEALVRYRGPRLRVVLTGVRHPSGEVPPHPALRKPERWKRRLPESVELRILDWVPFRERGRVLRGARWAILLSPPSLEARFAFRTRILDLLEFAVPALAVGEDVLTERLLREGAALPATLEPEALAKKIAEVWEDEARFARCQERLSRLAADFSEKAFAARARRILEFLEGAPLRAVRQRVLYRKYLEVRRDFRKMASWSHRLLTRWRRMRNARARHPADD